MEFFPVDLMTDRFINRNIQDKDGPIFADAFYEELFRGSDGKPMDWPDVDKSARAFDFAMKGAAFRHWVPFVYLGQ